MLPLCSAAHAVRVGIALVITSSPPTFSLLVVGLHREAAPARRHSSPHLSLLVPLPTLVEISESRINRERGQGKRRKEISLRIHVSLFMYLFIL